MMEAYEGNVGVSRVMRGVGTINKRGKAVPFHPVRKIGLDSEAENCRWKCVQREQLEVVRCLWHEKTQRAAATMGVAVW